MAYKSNYLERFCDKLVDNADDNVVKFINVFPINNFDLKIFQFARGDGRDAGCKFDPDCPDDRHCELGRCSHPCVGACGNLAVCLVQRPQTSPQHESDWSTLILR